MKKHLVLALALLGCATSARPQVVEYAHQDGLGSVRAVTEGTGAIVERYDYLPFGEEWNPQPAGQPLHFSSKERDTETGQDYFGARYYRATVGRFTTVDPLLAQQAALTEPQHWNRYAYSLNNPTRFTDPDGRHPIVIPLVLAALFVLNNPTNANVTQGPTHDTIVSNSVIVAGGYGYAAGGLRMAGMEVLGEGVGLPLTPDLSDIAKSRRGLINVLKTGLRKKAGFKAEGVPIILDNDLSATGMAEALRAAGYNVRSVREIFGTGRMVDEDIKLLADAIDARVLTGDRGRDLTGGFFERGIQVDRRIRTAESMQRILEHHLRGRK